MDVYRHVVVILFCVCVSFLRYWRCWRTLIITRHIRNGDGQFPQGLGPKNLKKKYNLTFFFFLYIHVVVSIRIYMEMRDTSYIIYMIIRCVSTCVVRPFDFVGRCSTVSHVKWHCRPASDVSYWTVRFDDSVAAFARLDWKKSRQHRHFFSRCRYTILYRRFLYIIRLMI